MINKINTLQKAQAIVTIVGIGSAVAAVVAAIWLKNVPLLIGLSSGCGISLCALLFIISAKNNAQKIVSHTVKTASLPKSDPKLSPPSQIPIMNRHSMCQKSLFQEKGTLGDRLRSCKTEVNAFLTNSSSHHVSIQESRAMGVMMGAAVGDALFSHIEFLPYKKEGYESAGQHADMDHEKISGLDDVYKNFYNNFHLEPGQWTDDTSMMLCGADAMILNHGEMHGSDFMKLSCDWWNHGYNNAFRNNPRRSVGLGGNISKALTRFQESPYVPNSSFKAKNSGDPLGSGNGSLMRLGPVVFGPKNIAAIMKIAEDHSYTTHEGREAAECCRVMAYIMHSFIHGDRNGNVSSYKTHVLDNLSAILSSHKFLPSVQGLIVGAKNVPNDLDASKLENWNWKDADFAYNDARIARNPGYVGAYAMDALAMALHCVYTTDSFADAVRKAGRGGGDADSVAAITGQIAGALYGIEAIPKNWMAAVMKHDSGGEIAARALYLMRPYTEVLL